VIPGARCGFRGFRREEPFSWLAACVPDASQEKPSSRLDGAERYSFSQERWHRWERLERFPYQGEKGLFPEMHRVRRRQLGKKGFLA
jgi:hypothetical protein